MLIELMKISHASIFFSFFILLSHSFMNYEFMCVYVAPMWNENSQVYQLDFGGRVTQESAKNFQIEFRGKQVSRNY